MQSATPSIPAPVLAGKIDETSLAQVFMVLLRRQFNGTLAVWPTDGSRGQDKVLFRDGVAVSIKSRQHSKAARDELLELFNRDGATYACYACDLVQTSGRLLGSSLHPITLVSKAVRKHFPTRSADSLLERSNSLPQRVRPGAPIDKLALRPEEDAFVEYVRAEPALVGDLIAEFGDKTVATRMTYLMLVTGCFEAYASSQAPRPRRSMPPPRLSSTRPVVSSVSRASMRPIAKLTPFEEAKKKAEAREWPAALKAVNASMESGKEDDPDHLALKAFILLHERGVDDPFDAREIRGILKKSVKSNDTHAHSYYVLGLFLRRTGDDERATLCFKKASRLDPRHIDAAREVSLAQIRSKKSGRRSLIPGLKR